MASSTTARTPGQQRHAATTGAAAAAMGKRLVIELRQVEIPKGITFSHSLCATLSA